MDLHSYYGCRLFDEIDETRFIAPHSPRVPDSHRQGQKQVQKTAIRDLRRIVFCTEQRRPSVT